MGQFYWKMPPLDPFNPTQEFHHKFTILDPTTGVMIRQYVRLNIRDAYSGYMLSMSQGLIVVWYVRRFGFYIGQWPHGEVEGYISRLVEREGGEWPGPFV